MNQLEAMKIFVRVAELASFTQAADSLGLPKASVSMAIKQLENALGTRLLQRTTRTVQMTQDGLVYYECSKDMLIDMDELQSMFRQNEVEISGRLRVDMPVGVARVKIIPRLPEFMRAHPKLDIELSSTDRRVDLIREGFDCVIRVGTLIDSNLIARPLGQFKLINCASPEYLKRHGMPLRIDDLDAHQMIHYSPSFGASTSTFDYTIGDQSYQKQVSAAIVVNNADAYQSACLAGLGIIQAPEIGVLDLLQQGRLIAVLPEYCAAPMPVSMLYPNRRHLPKRTQLFMNWVADVMREYE
ncbi:LysR family transcriptional regulator [Undibacterium jejuense]|uniref:LysR family transcriptional regulator n=1 Tax=Undibacterium jejuense TaxID=1344949 RepID=A0A923HK65_9BURK|nr:LysR family transcriptional regulator [Undibacterium jejuense]MBC3863237.1 LysR family transcriptional regulator [Undibacterium jejuense]